MSEYTRRDFVRLAGATAVGAAGITGAPATRASPRNEWSEAESPTKKTLYGVVETTAGPFAVGGGGDVLARGQNGWYKVVEYGPQARSRTLTAVDVTDGGRAIWFVGGSGVIGEYRVDTETLTNYSAPNGKTSTWEGCAVRGRAGEDERLYFVNGSGELLVGARLDGGAIKYETVVKPGGGSTIPGIDCHSRTEGHLCSTSQLVAETTDGGDTWERIGIDFAGTSFYSIASVGRRDVNVAAGNGIVYRYDGFRWTPHVVDDDRRSVRTIDRDGEEGLAAGDGGKIYERRSAGQWRRYSTPVETTLRGVSHGTEVDVAVGNGGAIVERTTGRTDSGTGTSTTTASTTSSRTSTTTGTTSSSTTTNSATTGTTTLPDGTLSVENDVEGEWVIPSDVRRNG